MRWILVADSRLAKVFKQRNKGEELQVVSQIENNEIHLHNQDIKEGKPGRVFESGPKSYQRHTMNTEVAPKKQSAQRFARDLCQLLEHGRVEHEFEHLAIIAEPEFLGEIKRHLGSQLSKLVKLTIASDLTHSSTTSINAHLMNCENGMQSA